MIRLLVVVGLLVGAVSSGNAEETTASTPRAAPSGLSHEELREIRLAIELLPEDALETALPKNPLIRKATTLQKLELLRSYRQSTGKRVGMFLLNILVLPGLGSIIQGDTTWGIFNLGGMLVGMGIMMSGVYDAVQGGYDWNTKLKVGLGLYMVAWLVGVVRPWVFESPRYRILQNVFASTLGLDPLSSLPFPRLVLQPSMFDRRRTVAGLGFAASF